MKTFIVLGSDWEREVDIDESLYEKYGDMAMEAMTLAAEDVLNNEDEATWGFILMAYEKGYKDDPNKMVACLTEIVFRNAGHHELAEQAKKEVRRLMDNGSN